jgi:hypothetical protein
MADAGADQYTFHLEATTDDEVEGLCRKVSLVIFLSQPPPSTISVVVFSCPSLGPSRTYRVKHGHFYLAPCPL